MLNLAEAPTRYTRLSLAVDEDAPLAFYRTDDAEAPAPADALRVTHATPSPCPWPTCPAPAPCWGCATTVPSWAELLTE